MKKFILGLITFVITSIIGVHVIGLIGLTISCYKLTLMTIKNEI